MTPQMVIQGACVITMTEHSDARPLSIAIEGERIIAVDTDDEIDVMVGPGTEVISMPGKTVLPGFIDTHVHFTQTGLGSIGPSVYDVESTEEIFSVIANTVARSHPDEPLLIHGCWVNGLDVPITCADLDRIAPANPVMIVDVGGHVSIVNSKAFDLLELPDSIAGIVSISSKVLSGTLVQKANALARYRYYQTIDDARRVEAIFRAAEMANQAGITTVHALDGGDPNGHGWFPERDVEILLQEQANLPVRTVIYFQSTNVDRTKSWNLPRIGGCLWVDGSYGEHTAALLEPYADDPSTSGLLYFSDDELNDFVGRAHRAGLQISMHAIGDAGIEQLLRAYERTLRENPRSDHRHRIEHFSLPTEDQIERVARLGIAVAMQPNFAVSPPVEDTETFQVAGIRHLGPERYRRRHAYRRIMDAGILIAGGSDSDPQPMGPLVGIQAVVNHRDEARRLTIQEALSLYTINAARIAFEEEEKGTIEPGKLADLVVLDDDPVIVSPSVIDRIGIAMTMVGGRVVYDNRN
ncbi:MAG: amidohydrolase [Anaerolineales bacterium]|nr:amidohydrolase [Anaerolineales bacterium]